MKQTNFQKTPTYQNQLRKKERTRTVLTQLENLVEQLEIFSKKKKKIKTAFLVNFTEESRKRSLQFTEIILVNKKGKESTRMENYEPNSFLFLPSSTFLPHPSFSLHPYVSWYAQCTNTVSKSNPESYLNNTSQSRWVYPRNARSNLSQKFYKCHSLH